MVLQLQILCPPKEKAAQLGEGEDVVSTAPASRNQAESRTCWDPWMGGPWHTLQQGTPLEIRLLLGQCTNTTHPCSWTLLWMKADHFCCLQWWRVFPELSPSEGMEEDCVLPRMTVRASLRPSQLEAVTTSSG